MTVERGVDCGADLWRQRYLASEEFIPIRIDKPTAALLDQVVALTGRSAGWWLTRALLGHVHGRLKLERAPPGSIDPLNRSVLSVPSALSEDLRVIARARRTSIDDVIAGALRMELTGVLGPEPIEVGNPGWSDDNESLKIWLPLVLHTDIKWLATQWDITANDVARNFLFTHLFGRIGYQSAVSTGAWAACRRRPDPNTQILFSRQSRIAGSSSGAAPRTARIRAIGKSGSGFRLWCPKPMKQRISECASRGAISPSEYARNVLLQSMYGIQSNAMGS